MTDAAYQRTRARFPDHWHMPKYRDRGQPFRCSGCCVLNNPGKTVMFIMRSITATRVKSEHKLRFAPDRFGMLDGLVADGLSLGKMR